MSLRLASALLAATLTTIIAATPARARDPAPDATVSFLELEFGVPYDPMLNSTDPGWLQHHTSRAELEYATTRLNTYIPVGMTAAEAAQRLHAAGAKCRLASAAALRCRYFDVQARGDFLDHIHWIVDVGLTAGRVSGLVVDRLWTRALGN